MLQVMNSANTCYPYRHIMLVSLRNNGIHGNRLRKKVKFFDMEDDNNHINENSQSFAPFSEPEENAEYRCDGQGTFVGFPSEDLVPLSEVVSKITRLTVLDCK